MLQSNEDTEIGAPHKDSERGRAKVHQKDRPKSDLPDSHRVRH